MKYKKLIIFVLLFIIMFFLIEFFMNIIFNDQTPLWKLVAIGIIGGLGAVYPVFKMGENLILKVFQSDKKEIYK